MKIVSNCPLCDEHSLHVLSEQQLSLMQCLYCGYASSDRFAGDKESNEEYQKLSDDMKLWSKTHAGRTWIPGILTLPEGMIYAVNIDNMVNHKKEMKWAYAQMINIPEEKQKDYANPEGGFYEQMYDIDNQKIYDNFYECLKELNDQASAIRKFQINTTQPEAEVKLPKLKLPKLKNVKAHAENN